MYIILNYSYVSSAVRVRVRVRVRVNPRGCVHMYTWMVHIHNIIDSYVSSALRNGLAAFGLGLVAVAITSRVFLSQMV